MSAIDLSSLSSLGSQYDFTNMTNLQLKNAAVELKSEGKISTNDEMEMVGTAYGCEVCRADGNNPSADQVLNDPTKHNFASYYQGSLKTAEDDNISPQTTELLQEVVNTMQQYQSKIEGNATAPIWQLS